eukprot:TCONS_00027673-protein
MNVALHVTDMATGDTSALKENPETKDKCNANFLVNSETNSVKGKLKPKLDFCSNTLKAPKYILDIIKYGYFLPFVDIPERSISNNNKSALENKEFVSESIRDLLQDGSAREVEFAPKVISPLSVASNSVGKKRLILDLRYVNAHLFKERISFDDWGSLKNLISENGFAYKFDLRKGYYHVEIAEAHQTYLGFSWNLDGREKFFIFCVLPFGLSSAPMIFTKLLRPLVSYWHDHGIKICVFLDDGGGTESNLVKAISSSNFVRRSLKSSGFVVNEEKSVWHPQKRLTWLGVIIDFSENAYFITEKRIEALIDLIIETLTLKRVTSRILSKVAGSIISMKFVLGDITQLKSRYLYEAIDSEVAWDAPISLKKFPQAIRELEFWLGNLRRLNHRFISEHRATFVNVYSDASDFGIGSHIPALGAESHRNLDPKEQGLSSTWRELSAILYSLRSFKQLLTRQSINWFTDNFAASLIVSKGSRKKHLQDLALDIFNFCAASLITLKINWIPREENETADEISKYIDFDDWQITDEFFTFLNKRWGPFSVDRFARPENTKLPRFNSKFFVPGSEAVDAFSENWSNEINYVVPPVDLIPEALKFILHSQCKGTLVIPLWKSAPFWSMIRDEFYSRMLVESIIITKGREILEKPTNELIMLSPDKYRGSMIAFKFDSKNIIR